MARFEINEVAYQSGKMAARTQVHVLRRMGKIIDPLFRLMRDGARDEEALGAFAEAFGLLSDDEVDYIMDNCLAVTKRQQGEAWAAVLAPDNKTCLFMDMDAAVQLQVVANVLNDNFEPLFQKALVTLSGGGNR